MPFSFHDNWNISPCYQATGFCKMSLFERGSHLSLLSTILDCPVSGTTSPSQEALQKLLVHSERGCVSSAPSWSVASSAPEGCDTHVPACTALPPSQVWQDGLGLSWLETGKTSALVWPKGSWHPSSLTEPQLLPCNWLPCRARATKPFHSGIPSPTFTASKGATPQILKSINPPSQRLSSSANRFHGQPRRSRGRFLYPAEANHSEDLLLQSQPT